jgi:hypothetical protein
VEDLKCLVAMFVMMRNKGLCSGCGGMLCSGSKAFHCTDAVYRACIIIAPTMLHAGIAADIDSLGDLPVRVSNSALPEVSFRVVAQVRRVYMPLGRR